MQEDGCFAGMFGDGALDFHEVELAVFGGPEHEFERTFAIGRATLGLEFAEFVAGEAAVAGAIVDLDRALDFDDLSRLKQAVVAGGDEGFSPQHDFGAAGEILQNEHAEGLAGFGDLRLDRADHAGEGETITRVLDFEFIDETKAAVAFGVDHSAALMERAAGDIEA